MTADTDREPESPSVELTDEVELAPRVVETHISLLFFVGDRVYKVRKPVKFGFLDFLTPEARRLDCEREVDLNRRLAADVYLGVADVEMEGRMVDSVVVMRRLPEDRNLAVLARRGAALEVPLRQVAARLADFHAGTHRSTEISKAATETALRRGWQVNFDEMRPFVGTMLEPSTDEEIRHLALQWTEGRGVLFEERIAQGRVCDGHGDLQAEDVFLVDEGVRILDCVEFLDELRFTDVAADVAFLVMDLERLGRADAASAFLAEYRRLSGDPLPDPLVRYYAASRAYVRSKVLCLRAAQGERSAREEARRFHNLALAHLRQARVRLVMVGGLPGTGKSTVASGLAAARGWSVVRSDEMRSRLPNAGAVGFERGRYSREATQTVYRALLEKGHELLVRGHSVVLDASWIDADWRGRARRVADSAKSDLIELCCVSSPGEADQRIVRRQGRHNDLSEATPEVREAMSAKMDPWPSARLIDTSGATPSESVNRALAAVGQ